MVALRASSKEHHGEQLQHIAETWELANTNANSPQDQFEQFKDHWNWRLADLCNHHAHAVVKAITKHNGHLFDIKSQWQETAFIGETLAPSQARAHNQALPATNNVASAVSPVDGCHGYQAGQPSPVQQYVYQYRPEPHPLHLRLKEVS